MSQRGDIVDVEEEQRGERKRKFRPGLPSVITGNMRSLPNKMDVLEALTRTNLKFQQCSIIGFTGTRLQEHITDSSIFQPGRQI